MSEPLELELELGVPAAAAAAGGAAQGQHMDQGSEDAMQAEEAPAQRGEGAAAEGSSGRWAAPDGGQGGAEAMDATAARQDGGPGAPDGAAPADDTMHSARDQGLDPGAVVEAKESNQKVWVANLTWWATDADIEGACSEFGKVASVEFIVDRSNGKSKGCALVEFATAEAAALCKQQMHGRPMHGRPMVVTFQRTGPGVKMGPPHSVSTVEGLTTGQAGRARGRAMGDGGGQQRFGGGGGWRGGGGGGGGGRFGGGPGGGRFGPMGPMGPGMPPIGGHPGMMGPGMMMGHMMGGGPMMGPGMMPHMMMGGGMGMMPGIMGPGGPGGNMSG